MNDVQLGKTGLRVSEIALGTMNFGSRIPEKTAMEILQKAFDLGINFFDTADAYGKSEEILGNWIKDSKVKDEIILSTKVGWPVGKGNHKGLSNKHIKEQLKESIKRLNVDKIEVYQPHYYDNSVDINELSHLFSSFVDQDLISIIGAPLFTESFRIAEWFYEAKINGYHNIGLKQIPFSLISRSMEKGETIKICENFNIPLINFGIFGTGILTSEKYHSKNKFPTNGNQMLQEDFNKKKFDSIIEFVRTTAEDNGLNMVELVYNWIKSQNHTLVNIVGVSNPDQLEELVKIEKIKVNKKILESISKFSDENFLW